MEKKIQKILIVCAANTCRSPMAEKIAKKYLPNFEISSAGLRAKEGTPISEHAASILSEHSLRAEHESQLFEPKEAVKYDLILTMEHSHIENILATSDLVAENVKLISDENDQIEIADPYGENYEAYKNCFIALEKSIIAWAKYLSPKEGA